MSFCTKCGGTGILIDDSPCDCMLHDEFLFNGLTCLDIPEQYQGLMFDTRLINPDMPEAYSNFMNKLYNDISSMKVKYKNILLCSPGSTSKKILAFSCIQNLFRKGIETYPLYDILEIKRIMQDTDLGRKPVYTDADPSSLLSAPYLFCKIPSTNLFEMYDTIPTLLDRRVRRGGSTIFLYNGSWEQLQERDTRNTLKHMVGDGSFTTIKVESWRYNKDGKE